MRERYNIERQDSQSWMTGYYVLEAIGKAFADKKNPHEYPPYPQLVETMDEAVKEKRRVAELERIRDQFLAASKHVVHEKQDEYKLLGEPV